MARRSDLDAGKTPEWAGATPLRCHRNRGGRSSPVNRMILLFTMCFARVQ